MVPNQTTFESGLLLLQRERDLWAQSATKQNGGRVRDVYLAATGHVMGLLGVDPRVVRAIEEGTLRVVDPRRRNWTRRLITLLIRQR
ncbi:MAG: hypothetical protein WA988_16435 [Candidatus Nanopelagicales bacterium]